MAIFQSKFPWQSDEHSDAMCRFYCDIAHTHTHVRTYVKIILTVFKMVDKFPIIR